MKTRQKFSTFSELKKEKESTEKKVAAEEIKYFLQLMRQGEITIESKTNNNAK
jgi:hypothetical protein